MITHRTIGSLQTVEQLAKAIRDMEIERIQVLAALNIILADSPAGEILIPGVDDSGTPAMFRLVAGAGVTITFDTGALTCTISSP